MATKECIIDSLKQNVARLFALQTLYTAGLHFNWPLV